MLLHLFLDSCQKEIKLSLIVYNGNLLGGDFVDKSLALTFDDLTSELIFARDKKYHATCLIKGLPTFSAS